MLSSRRGEIYFAYSFGTYPLDDKSKERKIKIKRPIKRENGKNKRSKKNKESQTDLNSIIIFPFFCKVSVVLIIIIIIIIKLVWLMKER